MLYLSTIYNLVIRERIYVFKDFYVRISRTSTVHYKFILNYFTDIIFYI